MFGSKKRMQRKADKAQREVEESIREVAKGDKLTEAVIYLRRLEYLLDVYVEDGYISKATSSRVFHDVTYYSAYKAVHYPNLYEFTQEQTFQFTQAFLEWVAEISEFSGTQETFFSRYNVYYAAEKDALRVSGTILTTLYTTPIEQALNEAASGRVKTAFWGIITYILEEKQDIDFARFNTYLDDLSKNFSFHDSAGPKPFVMAFIVEIAEFITSMEKFLYGEQKTS